MGAGTSLRIEHQGGDRFAIDVRGHRVVVDQPEEAGGLDQGPTPTELFVGSLAACVGFFAERFLRRHDLPVEGLAIEARFDFATERPARVEWVELDVRLPAAIPESRRIALERVIEHCTVHESIRTEPEVLTRVVEPAAAESVA